MLNQNSEVELELDEVTHTYRLGERILPSVTQVLKDAGVCGGPYPPGAGERGRLVHLACECDDLDGELTGLDDEIMGYVEGWRKFKQETGSRFTPEEIEVRRHKMEYAGTIDRVCVINRRSTVLDLKSGTFEPWHALQLAAYAGLLGGLQGRIAVYLSADGTYSVREFSLEEYFADLNTFRSALNIHNWKRKMNP